jgi:NTP pyrophosphatase (non-canonical NTP hydrolase)
MDRSHIYRATLEKWGEKAQYEQMVEECAELIAALKHFERGKIERHDIIAELADVTLMVGQLTWMFGEDEVAAAIDEKLAKLDALLLDPEGR